MFKYMDPTKLNLFCNIFSQAFLSKNKYAYSTSFDNKTSYITQAHLKKNKNKEKKLNKSNKNALLRENCLIKPLIQFFYNFL